MNDDSIEPIIAALETMIQATHEVMKLDQEQMYYANILSTLHYKIKKIEHKFIFDNVSKVVPVFDESIIEKDIEIATKIYFKLNPKKTKVDRTFIIEHVFARLQEKSK
jgi:hypothetical protein